MSRRPGEKPDSASQNLYAFIRLRLGGGLSDRELARRWPMEWKSFSALKHGRRQVPRLGELEQLARLLAVDPVFVFEVARGVPADAVNALLIENDPTKLSKLLMAGVPAVRGQAESAGQRYASALDRVSDAVFTFDVQGRLQDVNRRLCALTGFTAGELLERSFFDLLAPAERPELVQHAASVYQTGEVRDATFRVIAKDGAALTLELGLIRIDDASGHAIGVQAIAHDVTQHRRQEEQLRQQLEALRLTFDAVPAAWVPIAGAGAEVSGQRGEQLSAGEAPATAGCELRKFLRVPHQVPVQLRVGSRRTLALAGNLGRGGIFLQTEAALAAGSELSLEWTLPGRAAVVARGVVVWTQARSGETPAGVGVEFSELTARHQKLIARCVVAAARRTGPQREGQRRATRSS